MKLSHFALLILSCAAFGLSAQIIQPKQIDGNTSKGVLYMREYTFDFKLHTNGALLPITLGFNVGKLQNYYTTSFWHFDMGELRHQKEVRQSPVPIGPFERVPRPYKFGKQNNFYVLRIGKGIKRYLSEKADHKGVAVGYSIEAGPSIGATKPYYLEVRSQRTPDNPYSSKSIRYHPDEEDRFLNDDFIFGASSILKGFSEMKPYVGGHANIALHIDWGAFDQNVKALEAGLMIDAFLTEIPIIVERENVKNAPIFINVYISAQFGWRK